MQDIELLKLINDVKRIKTETNFIELKKALNGCPERLYDTLSSFSNQDDGGIIIFGIDEKNDFNISGVYDANDLIKKVTEQCKQMEPNVRALFTVAVIDDKKVVSAEIPGLDYLERPCYYKGIGKNKGSFIRVGDSDEVMNEYEIYSYESYKKRIKDDVRVIDEVEMKLLDNEKMNKYMELVKREKSNLTLNVNDEELKELMGLTKNGYPTLASCMVFSKYPQAYYPQFCITAVRVPGTEIGDVGSSNERFIDNKRITGPIDFMLHEALEFVIKNIKVKTIIDSLGNRVDKYEYPILAIREAILNALVHRDYSRYSEGLPIRIEIYNNRIEIINPGGLYGGISVKELGQIRPETRNIILANILEVLKISENRYSGIPTIRREMSINNLPAPIFKSKYGEFKVILKNSFDFDLNNTNNNILDFCQTPRSREEISSFLGMSKNHVMTNIVSKLVDEGKLALTLPDKPRSSFQKYYTNNKV